MRKGDLIDAMLALDEAEREQNADSREQAPEPAAASVREPAPKKEAAPEQPAEPREEEIREDLRPRRETVRSTEAQVVRGTDEQAAEPVRPDEPETRGEPVRTGQEQVRITRENVPAAGPQNNSVRGILEVMQDGYGFLRSDNFLPGEDDIYVSPSQIRRFHLRTGDRVSGKVRPRRENETHAMLLYVTDVNGVDAEDVKEPVIFDTLTPVYPAKQILLSKKAPDNKILRAIDLLCPIGFGQRALITAPSRSGKAALITAIADSIHAQYPEAELLCLMLGERPEDITIARDTAPGEVIYAGFDEPMENHTRIAELTLERAQRLAEQKKDVVLLVDSLTALCRAYSDCAPQNVRILSGGLAAGSMAKPKKLFGSARALREGGSLTIIAIMLSDTGIPLDQAIEKEFRGTANM